MPVPTNDQMNNDSDNRKNPFTPNTDLWFYWERNCKPPKKRWWWRDWFWVPIVFIEFIIFCAILGYGQEQNRRWKVEHFGHRCHTSTCDCHRYAEK
jgi:hypothetical protein